jgi:hypothetical protein
VWEDAERERERRTVVTFRSYMMAVEDDPGESDVSIPHRSLASYQLSFFSRKEFTFKSRQ